VQAHDHDHVPDVGRRPGRRPAPRGGRRRLALVGIAVLVGVLAAPLRPAGAGPAEDTSFVRAVHVDLLGREPTSGELTSYVDLLVDEGGTRSQVVRYVAYGPENLTQEVVELYDEALDRAPDDQGLAHWVNTMGYTSFPLSWTNAGVYGSQEYVNAHAAAPGPWVEGVFADMIGRSPDPAGLSYWTGVAATKGPAFAALRLYESTEHRRTRVTEVFQEMLGRAPEPDALAFWTSRLTVQRGDLWLAIQLGATPEYGARAVARFP
jgi:hypothetical protein